MNNVFYPYDSVTPFVQVMPPVPDSDELASAGRRVLLYFTPEMPSVTVVPKGTIFAGWVIGREG